MPTIALVHHSDAVAPEVDSQRPLSAEGRMQAERLASEAQHRGIKPAVIWHSGKLRARQTAEPFLRLCNPFAQFKMVRGLLPEDTADWIRQDIDAEPQDLLLVSHMPLMHALAGALLQMTVRFPLHGMIVIERVGERTYVERWRSA